MVPALAINAVPSSNLPLIGTGTALPELSLFQAVYCAVLGGIILNLMPCVFPMLSIKVLGFVRHGQGCARAVRRHGMVFTAGVLGSFAVIAGLLIILQAGGAQIGWGFQLQSPVFVTVLACLIFAMGLSLSGVLTVGSSLMGFGHGLAARPGYAGSLATGALTTVVATPCTAPFMGASICFALTQPWYISLVIFEALGFGLALPYLLLSFTPALLRFLPRPGPWMERLKKFLAWPMYATVAWLVWVLGLQAGSAGVMAALAGMSLIVVWAWLLQASFTKNRPRRRLAGIMAMGLVMGIAVGVVDLPAGTAAFVSQDSQQTRQGPIWESFSASRLAELRADKRPVFINFSAAWCITCLANERMALSSPKVAARFKEKGLIYLKGDWTNQDPEITKALAAFGRSGVPLYVLYPPIPKAGPIILPQVLTETLLLERLERL